MTKLKAGDRAPEFTAINHLNEPIASKQFMGKKLVLFFYPKDNTPTCTNEACNLRDHYSDLINAGFEVVGVSPDSVRKHQNFIKKYNLPFQLIADTELNLCRLFDVWGDKVLFGLRYQGVIRTTFIINESGIIERVIDQVKSGDHANQIRGIN